MKLVSYLRVSTSRQGASGLGLEAQREAVTWHIATTGASLIGEYVEIETGSRNDRPILAEAMTACKRHRAGLVIAKLDRLGRNVAFITALIEAKTDFVALDAPYANKMMLQLLAVFAEHEREMISERTKAALAAARARGVKLGGNGARLAAANKAEAVNFAKALVDPVAEIRLAGAQTLQQIAAGLNARGLVTREGAAWSTGTVQRLVQRIAA